MRGLRSSLVVAAVCGLALLATVDALQAEQDRTQGSDASTVGRAQQADRERAAVAAELRRVGVAGVLTYSGEDCELHALSLPSLAPHPAPVGTSCRFVSSPGGMFAPGPGIPDPQDDLTATCFGGTVEVRVQTGRLVGHARACAPAWKPNGVLTALQDDNVVRLDARPGRRALVANVLVSRDELERGLAHKPWAVRSASFKEIAWLSNDRLAAIVTDAGRRKDLLAIFQGGRFATAISSEYEGLVGLRVSPRGSFVAARIRKPRNLVIVDAHGRYVANGVPGARAIAWSPDERWAAVATLGGVSFLKPAERQVPIVLVLGVTDLAWR